MPSKQSRAGRQAGRQAGRKRRAAQTGARRQATEVAPSNSLFPTPSIDPGADVGVATAPRAPAVTPRTPRRPTAAAPANASLATEQVRNEVRYIRGDIARLVVTTLIVVVFMVAANFLLN